MTNLADRHASDRNQMLAAAVAMLQSDERFTAAWLAGSFGRGDHDALSDLDLWVVVADPHARQLCRRTHQVGAGTTSERRLVIGSVGEPAIIHENHHNAPLAGSFTTCIYAGTGVMIDWVFVAASKAIRAHDTHLIFDHNGVPSALPEPPLAGAERVAALSEQVAFFWMMTRPTLKALHRDDLVQFHLLLDMLVRTVENIERILAEQPVRYQRGSRSPLLVADSEQREFVMKLCQRVEHLHPSVRASGASVPENPAPNAMRWLARTV